MLTQVRQHTAPRGECRSLPFVPPSFVKLRIGCTLAIVSICRAQSCWVVGTVNLDRPDEGNPRRCLAL